MLKKVISGGQTGADRAALYTAALFGYETGGWMPKGFRALDGKHPEYAILFGMRETESSEYPPRTKLNVEESDYTIRIASDFSTPGERCTLNWIVSLKKLHIDVNVSQSIILQEDAVNYLARKLIGLNVQVLNIAGNSEKSAPGITIAASVFLTLLFTRLNDRTRD